MKVRYDFTVSGFMIGLVVISLFATVFGLFLADTQQELNITGENSLLEYNRTATLIDNANEIRNSTDITQQEGILDVIGGYFSAGYGSIKTALQSFGLFEDMMNQASEDVEAFSLFKPFIIAIVIIALFVGVLLSALLKMRV